MRVLLTGGSGFLGSHIAEQLKNAGHTVVCLVRRSSDVSFLETLGVERVFGAVDDASTLPGALAGVDAIVHAAGLVKARNAAEFDRVNAAGTRSLAEAAIAHAPSLQRFVHVSTAAVMGPGREGQKLSDRDPKNPQTLYAKSKLAAEKTLLELRDRLPITILRPPAIYGPRDREILAFFTMVRRMRVAFRLGGSLKSVSMIYVDDCARACVRAISADVPSGSAYLLDDGNVYSYEGLSRAIADGYGVKLLTVLDVPTSVVRAAAAVSDVFGETFDRAVIFGTDKLGELLMEHFVVDASDARRDLGWAPEVEFAEGARRTAAFYREHRWD